jgi:hypothetical protein
MGFFKRLIDVITLGSDRGRWRLGEGVTHSDKPSQLVELGEAREKEDEKEKAKEG